MSVFLAKAQLLIEQNRYELAESELNMEISQSPDNPVAHALLALCLSHQKKYEKAVYESIISIGLAPNLSLCHYVYSIVLSEQGKILNAEKAINEAIGLDPWHPEYFAMLGNLKLQQKKWQEALVTTEEGLKIDPEHIECINLRGMALTKLGFKNEAIINLDSALARDPENAVTHSNLGWNLLEHGEHKKALEHFREALRLEPNLEFAREGIVESLKARNFIYRLLLRYFFWMAKFSNKNQWIFIIGLIVGINVLREISRNVPALAPFLSIAVILYFIFVFLGWTAEPIFNLLLRFDKFGRFALSENEIAASNIVGLLLMGAAINCFLFFVPLKGILIDHYIPFFAAIYFALMIMPTAGTFAKRSSRGKKILGIYTILLGLEGALAVVSFSLVLNLFVPLSVFFVLALVSFTWMANFIR
jgi:tetratricopeptide (TPR) repeat protein